MVTKVINNDIFFLEVAKNIASGQRVRIKAKGNSMLPFIRDTKDLIILEKPNEQSFQKGCILLVHFRDERYLLHRVKTIDNTNILLKGDGNLSILENCTPEQVVAEATTVIRGSKTIEKGSLRWNLYRYLWPNNLFVRRVFLALYRRVLFLKN